MPPTSEPLAWALGVIGVILSWFMFRVERRLEAVTVALNAFTTGMMIEVITRRGVPPDVERSARAVLRTVAPDSEHNL